MTFAEYEHLVKDVVSSLLKQVSGLTLDKAGSGRPNHELGASGFPHQIDVSIRTEMELHIIECKCWDEPVTADAVLCLAARVCDIQKAHPSVAVKGALATTQPPSSGAHTLAKFFHITLQRVPTAEEFANSYKNEIHVSVRPEGVRSEDDEPRLN